MLPLKDADDDGDKDEDDGDDYNGERNDDDEEGNSGYLVLQHSSGSGPFITPPGLLLHFETPAGPPTIIANCLTRPTAMTLDETGTLYVTELAGRIVAIPVTP